MDYIEEILRYATLKELKRIRKIINHIIERKEKQQELIKSITKF